jgi:DNA-directed RNA polymerase specialized sigma24 family protein
LPTTIKYSTEQLTRLTQQKDKGEFGKLYDSYSPVLYGVVIRILNQNQKMAEDVLREVFVTVWNEIEAFDPSKETLFIWLLRIARSTAHDKLESSNHGHSGITSNILVSNKNIAPELSDTSRTIIDLLYAGKYSLKEISQKLNLPEESVKSIVRETLIAFKSILA